MTPTAPVRIYLLYLGDDIEWHWTEQKTFYREATQEDLDKWVSKVKAMYPRFTIWTMKTEIL